MRCRACGDPEFRRSAILAISSSHARDASNPKGWLTALTKGTAGYAQTWEFFRNTLLSGGLFTGLFVGAMKLTDAGESAREKEVPEAKEETDGNAEPGEAKA